MRSFMFTDDEAVSIGRNGDVITVGIGILEGTNSISIFPITSKKKLAHGCVSVPRSELRLLIENLQEVLSEQEEEMFQRK